MIYLALKFISNKLLLWLAVSALIFANLKNGEVCAVHPSPTLTKNSISRDEFFQNAPSQWKEYRQFLNKLQGSWTFRIKTSGFATSEELTRTVVRRNATAKLLIVHQLHKNSSPAAVYAINPKYAFYLRRKASDAPWVILQTNLLDQMEVSKDILKLFVFGRQPFSKCVNLGSHTLAEVIKKPYFKIRQIESVVDQGKSCVAIHFDYNHPVVNEPDFNMIQGGSMILDPKGYWCIRRLSADLKTAVGHGKLTLRNEYDESKGTFPIPTRAVYNDKWALKENKTYFLEGNIEYDLKILSPLPGDQEFKLTAFGLPEPFGIESKSTPWYFWAGGAGIAFIVMGGFFLWLKNRST